MGTSTGVNARSATRGLLGATALITIITIVSRVLGFGRWLAQEAAIGHGVISGAYNAANTLPNIVFEAVAGGAIAGAVIPLLAGPVAQRDTETTNRIASGILGWTMAALVPMGVLLAVLAHPLAAMLTSDPGPERTLVARLIVVFAVQLPLYGLSVVVYGVLQAHHRFFWPAFAPIVSTLATFVVYAGYAAASKGSDDPAALSGAAFGWLAWGTTGAVAALSLPGLVPLWRAGVRLRPTLRLSPDVARRARGLAFAGVGALVAQQGATLVMLWWARRAGDAGANTVLQYTQALWMLPYAVLAVPIATSSFPRLAAHASVGDTGAFARLSSSTTRAVVAGTAVGAAALAGAAPAVAGLFALVGGSRSAGSDESLRTMIPALAAIAPGIVGLAVTFHVSRALYAVGRARGAVAAGAWGWGTVAVAASVGSVLLTERGDVDVVVVLSGATSVGMMVAAPIALAHLRTAAGGAAVSGLLRTVLVTATAAVAAGTVGRMVCDAVLDLAGHGLIGVLGAGSGCVAAVVAVAMVVMMVADRRTLDTIVPGLRSGEPRR